MSPYSIIRPVSYPAVDGLRFYAALAVFIEHTFSSAAVNYFRIPGEALTYKSDSSWMRTLFYFLDGNHGVDIFFIISGFLMARIVLTRPEAFSYGTFLWNRVKRIYPAFVVALIVAMLGDVLIFDWPWKPIEFLKNLAFLNAIHNLPVLAYNNVTWSLGYEFAFYLVIPALLLLRMGGRGLGAALLLLGLAYLLIPDYYLRTLGLFVGAVVGAASPHALSTIARRTPLPIVLGLFVGCGLLKATYFTTYHQYYYSFLVVAALLFIKVTFDDRNLLSRFLATRPLRVLGTLSYSIYLYHSIIGSVVLYKLTPWPASWSGLAWYSLATIVLTLLISYLSYTQVEQRYFLRKRPVPASLSAANPSQIGS